MENETGWWTWAGKNWFVKRRLYGGVSAESEDGCYTSVSDETWGEWKLNGHWVRNPQYLKSKET